MLSINNHQNPSTLDLLTVDEVDFWLSCRSKISNDRVEEQVRGGRDEGNTTALVGEIEGLVPGGGDGEELNLGGWLMIPLRLGDLDMFFPLTLPGSCNGNREGCFISWIVFSRLTMVLMVGLSDGSFCRHFCAISATVRAALTGNRPLSWGSIINESLHSSARKGLLHLTKFLSSLGYRLSRFFLPVSNSSSTIPKLQTFVLGVSKPFSNVSAERFPSAWTHKYKDH